MTRRAKPSRTAAGDARRKRLTGTRRRNYIGGAVRRSIREKRRGRRSHR